MIPLHDFKQPAVFLANGLGDQLIALPAMRALGTLFPDGMQLILGPGMYWFFYRGIRWRGESSTASWTNFEAAQLDVARTVARAQPCDVFISLSTWVTPSVIDLARQLGARTTVGYHECFDERVNVDGRVHMFDRLFAIPQHLDPPLRFETFAGPPVLSPAAERAGERYIAAVRRPGERILFVHPETRRNKMWSDEHLAWVLTNFLDQHPDYKAIVTSMKPTTFPVRHNRLQYTDAHLELALAIMKRADVFMGVDSCFLHAADLFRLPGLALFGPTDPDEWGFRVSPQCRCVASSSMDEIRRDAVLDALCALAGSIAATSVRTESRQSVGDCLLPLSYETSR